MTRHDYELLAETSRRLFSEQCTDDVFAAAERGEPAMRLWQAVEEAGLPQALLMDETRLEQPDLMPAMAVLTEAGRFAAPLPIAETMLSHWLLRCAGIEAPSGPLALAIGMPDEGFALGRGKIYGEVAHALWVRPSGPLVLPVADTDGGMKLALFDHISPEMLKGFGLDVAAEPCADVLLNGSVPDRLAALPPDLTLDRIRTLRALARSMMILGAMERVSDTTATYVRERRQFGRPLSAFQAVQQQIAVMAAESIAVRAIVSAAASSTSWATDNLALWSANAKSRMAADGVARIGHQLHGALGFTHENGLHHLTKRLWAWREEDGAAAFWQSLLATESLKRGPAGLWAYISS